MFAKLDRAIVALEKIASDAGQPAHPHKMVVEHATTLPQHAKVEDFTVRHHALSFAVSRGGHTTEVMSTARKFYDFLNGKMPSLEVVDPFQTTMDGPEPGSAVEATGEKPV